MRGAQSESIRPCFHETVTLAVAGRTSGMRVLLTGQGIVYPLVRFFEENLEKSAEWQRKTVRAVGLLFDYFCATSEPRGLSGKRTFLSDFINTLLCGTVGEAGKDPIGLGWHPQKPS